MLLLGKVLFEAFTLGASVHPPKCSSLTLYPYSHLSISSYCVSVTGRALCAGDSEIRIQALAGKYPQGVREAMGAVVRVGKGTAVQHHGITGASQVTQEDKRRHSPGGLTALSLGIACPEERRGRCSRITKVRRKPEIEAKHR